MLDVLAGRDLPWAIVTSATGGSPASRLGAARISAPLVGSVEDVAKGKPAPDGYLAGAHGRASTPIAAWSSRTPMPGWPPGGPRAR